MNKKIETISFPDLAKARKRDFSSLPLLRKADLKIPEELKKWAEGKTFTVFTSGCQANVRDSEIIIAYLLMLKMIRTEDSLKADLVLFNTCAIRENAEKKIYGELGALKQSALENKDKIIGVCGCMAQEEKPMKYIRDNFPYANLVFGTHNIDSLFSLLNECIVSKKRIFDVCSTQGEVVENLPSYRFDKNKAYVNIMYGCDNFCTYCIVPYTRGRQRSRQIEEIVKEVECLRDKGYKEVTLLGQNVNAYGYDLKDENVTFAKLLEAVAKTDIPRIRFMTSHPAYFKEDVFKVMSEHENIMPQLHLPLQSGSDSILKKMNRHYDSKQYMDLVHMLRRYIPDVYLTTDIIVGFPNETDEDFEDTLKLCEEVKFDNAFTFIFSPREGTPAYLMEDKTDPKVKSERFDRLLKVIDKSATESAEKEIGKIEEVLFDSVSKKNDEMISGYTRHDRLVHVKGTKDLIGQIRKVKIIESHTYSLIGELI